MNFPPFLNLILGPLFVLFGVFRINLGRKVTPLLKEQGGMRGQPKLNQYFVGTIYIAAGLFVIYLAASHYL